MWRVPILALTVVLFSTASAQATVLFSEDFESGVDGWFTVGSPDPPLRTNNYNTTPGGYWSMYTPAGKTQYVHQVSYGPDPNWYVTWNFFDSGASNGYLRMRVPKITGPSSLR